MSSKFNSLSALLVVLFGFSNLHSFTPIGIDQQRSTLHVDFEDCVSYFGGYNADYSEFTADADINETCTTIALAGGHVYRMNPEVNVHSCAPGVDSTVAMCIGSLDTCAFVANDERALRFDVLVVPGDNGFGSIDEISFYSRSPENFVFIDGGSGLNNYPTRFGIRASIDTLEIFRQEDIVTTTDWSLYNFDFASYSGFRVEEATIISFEILPYCLVGNNSPMNAWDIDDLIIVGGCNEVNGGHISLDESTSICYPDSQETVKEFQLEMELGESFSWIVTDQSGIIVELSDSSSFDFNLFENGIFNVQHLAYDTSQFSGLIVGESILNLAGCFDLSNSIQIFNNKIEAGTLTAGEFDTVYICSDDPADNLIELEYTGAVSSMTQYLLLDESGIILESGTVPEVDMGPYSAGLYEILAISHNGGLFNAIAGMHISALSGCYVASNSIAVEKEIIDAGSISFDGEDEFIACTSSSLELNPSIQDTMGGIHQWVLYTPSGMIVSITQDTPIDISMMLFPTLHLINLAYLSEIEGLALGENINDLVGCYDSSNVLTVDLPDVDGGTISTNGLDSISICLNDSLEAMVIVDVMDVEGTAYSLLVTDEMGEILSIPSSDTIDFSGAGSGVCFIWNIAFVNTLDGFEVGANVEDIVGCYDLSNSIAVNREELMAAELATDGGLTEVSICSGDGASDSLVFVASGFTGSFSSLVITDTSGMIITIPPTDTIDFEGVEQGICLVYHIVSSNDSILNGIVNISELSGCFELSNAVIVDRTEVNGGSIMTVDSMTQVFIVIGDMIPDEIEVVLNSAVGDSMIYIITDSIGNILELTTDPVIDFSDAEPGTCYIYNISYVDSVAGLEAGMNISALSGCYDLSNSIEVNRVILNGGDIIYADSTEYVFLCTGDSEIDTLDVLLANEEGPLSSWIVTDTSGLILEIDSGPPFIFDQTPTGLCHIWHISYTQDLMGLMLGNQLTDLTGPFNLSNSIDVERSFVDGGMIMSVDSLTSITICTSDTLNDIVDMIVTNSAGDSSVWLVVDDSNIILDISNDSSFDFNGVANGNCAIYHLSFNDSIQSLEIDGSLDSLSGCFDLSNAVEVSKTFVDGGVVSEASGADTINIIVGDGIIDSLDFSVIDAVGDSMIWVITDSIGQILELSPVPPVDFESAGEGICHVYHLSYSSDVTGLSVGNNISAVGGCSDFSNDITIIRQAVNGGVIMTLDSLTSVDLCIVEMSSTPLDVLIEEVMGDSSQWIITDDMGMILELPASPPFDFSDAPTGICQIYHISWIGSISGLTIGNNISMLMGSFDLSNSIEVIRNQVDGGIISDSSGLDTLTFVTNDGLSDIVDLDLTGEVGDSMVWLISDEDGNILALQDSLSYDFEGSGAGFCFIHHLSYNDSIIGLEIDSAIIDLEGCFDLSNTIVIEKQILNGGFIITTDSLISVNVCLSDTIVDIIDVTVTDTFGMNYSWIITDVAGMILELPSGPPFDFSSNPVGLCQIWHIAYQDNLMGLMVGNNLSDLTGSYDLSNNILVNRGTAAGGILALSNGMTTDTITVGDGIVDTISLMLATEEGENFVFLISDTLGFIMEITTMDTLDFESAGGGVCLITNLSYSGAISGLMVGNNISDLDGCYDLSNSVTIVRLGLMGGTLTDLDGETEIQLCLSDTLDDSFDVILMDTIGPMHSWVLSDANNIIIDLPMGPPFDFTSFGIDECQLRNIAFDTTMMGLMVGSSIDSITGNFNFSNPLLISKDSSSASMIMTSDSLTDVTITVGEGTLDLIDVIVSGGEGDSSIFVVTDTLGNIISIQNGSSFDFESSGGGVCEIWHLNFADGLSGLVVGSNLALLEGCYELSNQITVTKIPTIIIGGNLTTIDLQTEIEICVGNGSSDDIEVILMGNEGPNFQWVISDTSGLILGLPSADPFNLELAGPGVCQIWNLSYANGLMGLAVGENIDDLIGFYDFSNPITVTRNSADGGSIETTDGMTSVTIPVGDGVIDTIDVILTGEDGEFQDWIITDANNVITDLSSSPPFEFGDVGGGVCLIYSISYSGALVGLAEGNSLDMLEGCFDLSNAITVTKEGLNGGVLTDLDGNTEVDYCNSSSYIDTLQVLLSDTMGMDQQYVIVDTASVILHLDTLDVFDLSSFTEDVCFIYNISYNTLPGGLVVGDSLDNLTGMYALSNALTVTKVETAGGDLSYGDGSLIDTIDVGDGIVDTITVLLSGNMGEISQWMITDTLGNILDLPVSDPFEFGDVGGGVCYIYNISFQIGLTGLVVGNNLDLIDGCYSLSNPVTLVKEGLNGGLLTFDDLSMEREICFGDGVDDFTSFLVSGTEGDNQEILITRTNGQLFVVNSPNPFNFESIPANIDSFIIYNIAFDTVPGNYTQGSFLGNLTGNFDLSNPITLIRDIEKGGTITDSNGLVESTIVVADGEPDTLVMVVSGEFADSLLWISTDEFGIIESFSDTNEFVFDSLGSDVCHIYHIGFNPNDIMGLAVGESIDSLSGCFSISNNYILTKKALNGGVLTDSNGMNSLEICSGDGIDDILEMLVSGNIGSDSLYTLVNSNGVILLNQSDPVIDISAIPPGDCQIYFISHDGSLTGATNGNNIANLSGCFDLSTPVDISKLGVFGGTLTFQGGGATEDVCVGDGLADNLIWNTTSFTGEYIYAITDTMNVIDTLIAVNTLDFDGFEPGVCRIWGISYEGTLVAEEGDTVGVDILVENCFEVSSNFLTVNKMDCGLPRRIDYTMYPNPVIDQLSIDIISLPYSDSKCYIYGANGKLMHVRSIDESRLKLDIDGLEPGVYYMQIRSGGFVETDKFIILR